MAYMLIDKIEVKRQEMYDTATDKGGSHPDTLLVSQELDALILDYLDAQKAHAF